MILGNRATSSGSLQEFEPTCRVRRQRKVYTRDAAVQSFDSIDDQRFPSPSSRWSPPLSEATSSSAICARPSLAPPRRAFIFSDVSWCARRSGISWIWRMRALGLDVGSKTIGLAMTDEAMIAAHPLTVLQRVGNSGDAAAVAALVARAWRHRRRGRDAVRAVGQDRPSRAPRPGVHRGAARGAARRGAAARAGRAVHHRARPSACLIEADVSRAQRRGVIDQQAAALILQAWLDAQRVARLVSTAVSKRSFRIALAIVLGSLLVIAIVAGIADHRALAYPGCRARRQRQGRRGRDQERA